MVGVSSDHAATLEAFAQANHINHLLLSDFGRTMLPAYGLMVTDAKSPVYRYARRAYIILDSKGIVRYVRVQANPLDLLKPDDVLNALKGSGA